METCNYSPGPPGTKLSVVIRCRNEAENLRDVLRALRAQRCSFPWEAVVVDNESDDGTRDVCEEFGARVVSIGRAEFTYGRALNLGIDQARGELVLLLSAHSIPVGSHFLESAVAPFDDPLMAAARCLMVDNADQMSRWFAPRDIQYGSPEEQEAAESGTRWLAEYPTNGCCIIRRSVWEQVRYDEALEYNEDKLWASQVLARNFKIRNCCDAVWLYTRRYGRWGTWRRRNRGQLALYRLTGRAPLGWWSFTIRVARALVVAPIVAVRYVVDCVVWDTLLVTIPLQARSAPRPGSMAEFESKRP